MSKFFGAGAADRGAVSRPVDDLDVGQIWRAVVARRLWIIIPTLLACIGAAVAVNLMAPRYTAETRIFLQNGDNFYTRPGGAPELQGQIDGEAVQSQVQLIMSRDLAREAIRKLDLTNNPLFNNPDAPPGLVRRLTNAVGIKSQAPAGNSEERALDKFAERLQVFQVGKSRVLAIEFTAEDPDLAARVANTVAELYIALQQTVKQEAARSASEWLASNIEPLRKRVAEAEARVEDFRAKTGLLLGSGTATLPTQQLADLSAQLAASRTAQSDAQAKAKMIRSMLGSGNLLEIPEVANNDLVRRLTEQRIALRTQLALESRNLLPEHPRIKELNAQLSDLDGQIRMAAERAVRAFESDARLAGSRVDSLVAAINAQKQVAVDANENEVKLRALELDARSEREQLEGFLAKYREAQVRDSRDAAPADARIVSRAVAPSAPTFPKKVPIILIATLATFALTSVAVLSLELISGRATIAREEESYGPAPQPMTQATQEPFLTLPAPIDAEFRDVVAPAAMSAEDPPDNAGGSFDVILSKLALPEHKGRGRRLFVAEANVTAGSTDMARALARHLSRTARTVLINLVVVKDVDFEEPGLTDLVTERAGFSEVLGREAGSRLHVVAHGTQPSEVLVRDPDAVALSLSALDQTYEWVVCGLSPGLDPAILGAFASRTDGSVLVSREADDEEATLKAYQNLQGLGAQNIVVAVTPSENDGPLHRAA
ncbi:exopolysaccharide transport family protein [Chelatococcus sp. YT9]|uniref:GumC family protein n=1 Tax=Chelatococcus sp. YT9 TaxID=2835635 RepID=UPI001BCCC029|nr:exopolysaccharide transport family protein [Chelatococcus sp. YT9]MBS7698837.1 lipopolysaccharide biosynthesis protein [Chelatococcus sp. YT9]